MSAISGLKRAVKTGVRELRRPGETDLPGAEIYRLAQVLLILVIVSANVIGACAVLVIAYFVLPLPTVANPSHVELVNGIAAAAYVAVAVPVGVVGGRRLFRLQGWLTEERAPTPREIRTVLYGPLRLFALQVSLWLVAAVLFGVINSTFSTTLGVRVAIVVMLTGLITASCAYLLSERILRPAAARALADGTDRRFAVPGVATRAVLAWLLGTGLPVCTIVAIGILALAGDPNATLHRLAVVMVVLGGTGIAVGLMAVTLAARTTADPIDSVRRALADVQDGDFDVRVPVYDGSQIGQLQLGFNRMAGGLAEREKIRDAFGAYVDPDVAERILKEGTDLAGEQVEVTIMFIDIRDFTGFAEETPADEVVSALNELFEQIVPIIHDKGGRVDKFVGDGLLAVFGAPRRQEDHADQALAAALQISREVKSEQGLELGIGLNSGTVVAGNLGGAGRLEFSVIGDPVNVAARVEAATKDSGDQILIAERTKELLGDSHPDFAERTGIELKGKREKVRVYAPQDGAAPSDQARDGGDDDDA
ncbi:MAG TPA: adenylate/guanylate cyclase domain-containing protein [Solirubrobacteraceae bacterium]